MGSASKDLGFGLVSAVTPVLVCPPGLTSEESSGFIQLFLKFRGVWVGAAVLPLCNPGTLQLLGSSFTEFFGLNQKTGINSLAQCLASGTYPTRVGHFRGASGRPHEVLARTLPNLKMMEYPSRKRDLESGPQSGVPSFHRGRC